MPYLSQSINKSQFLHLSWAVTALCLVFAAVFLPCINSKIMRLKCGDNAVDLRLICGDNAVLLRCNDVFSHISNS